MYLAMRVIGRGTNSASQEFSIFLIYTWQCLARQDLPFLAFHPSKSFLLLFPHLLVILFLICFNCFDMFALWIQITLVSAWSCLAAAISITVSDRQTSMGVVGTNAIDGNNATFWHSLYKPTAAPLPHTATLDLGAVTSVRGFTYLPRQDVKAGLPLNGNIGQHDIQMYVMTKHQLLLQLLFCVCMSVLRAKLA